MKIRRKNKKIVLRKAFVLVIILAQEFFRRLNKDSWQSPTPRTGTYYLLLNKSL